MPGLRIKQGGLIPFTYTIKKDGQPQQEERNLASVLADGSEKTITGGDWGSRVPG